MRLQILLSLAVTVGIISAGCPSGSTTLQTIPSADSGAANANLPSSQNNGENSGAPIPAATGSGNGTTVTAGASFEAQLNQTFPACGDVTNASRLRATIMDLVNQARIDEGMLPVVHNQTLEDQATQYACEMITYDFFAHDNPFTGSDLATRAREFNYRYLVIGENLAAGQPTAQRAFADWMDSPGHRANILDARFTELGIGVRTGGSFGTYWVQEFGRPSDQPFRPEAQSP